MGIKAEVAKIFDMPEDDIWPSVIHVPHLSRTSSSEIVEIYPHRADVPQDLWQELLESASSLDVLVYAGLFLPEQHPGLATLLVDKSATSGRVRFLLGDPACQQVAQRGQEEQIDDAVAAKIRNVMGFYQPLAQQGHIDVRLHQTTLYNSIYRFDDNMLVNTHIYGLPAAHAPIMHLRQLSDDGLFATHAHTFERIWDGADVAWPMHQAVA